MWAPLQKSADDRMPAVGSKRDACSLGSLYTRQLGCLQWAPKDAMGSFVSADIYQVAGSGPL